MNKFDDLLSSVADTEKAEKMKALMDQLTALAEENREDPPECYYNSSTGKFAVAKPNGCFEAVTQDAVKLYLRKAGIPMKKGERLLSPLEEAVLKIITENSVTREACLAGHNRGVIDTPSGKILVPKDRPHLQPAKGDFSFLQHLLERQLGRDGPEQVDVFKSWLKTAYSVLDSKTFMHGQALCLVGSSGTCKSFLAKEVIVPILGGRSAKPVQYMKGRTDFNLDLCESEILLLDDEDTEHLNYQSRRAFANMIKSLLVGGLVRVHGKGKDGFSAPIFWRLVICMNDDPDTVQSIPAQDESVRDKLIVLRMSHPLENAPRNIKEWAERDKATKDALPGFLWHLLNEYEIPESLVQPRYGVASYQNPEYRKEFLTGDLVGQLAEMLNSLFFSDSQEPRELTAEEIVVAKNSSEAWRGACGKAFSNPTTVGRYMKQLAKRYDNSISGPNHTRQGNVWRVKPINL